MTRTRWQSVLRLTAAAVLIAGCWTTLQAQSVIAPEEVPLGATTAQALTTTRPRSIHRTRSSTGSRSSTRSTRRGSSSLPTPTPRTTRCSRSTPTFRTARPAAAPAGSTTWRPAPAPATPATAPSASAACRRRRARSAPSSTGRRSTPARSRRTRRSTSTASAATGSIVNATPFPCWGPNATHVTYRTWVFPHIVPGINSDYSVTGLASGLTTGQDPWVPYNTVFPLSQGASLVVLYTDKGIPRGTWVQIHHPQTAQFFGTLTFTHFLDAAADGRLGQAHPDRVGRPGRRRDAQHQLDDRRADLPRRPGGDAAGADPGQRLLGPRQRGLGPQRHRRRADEPALGHPHHGGLGGDHADGDQLHRPVHRAHRARSGTACCRSSTC